MSLPSGNPFKCHEEVLYLQPMIPHLNVLTFSPLTGGCSEGLDAFRFFFKYYRRTSTGDAAKSIIVASLYSLKKL